MNLHITKSKNSESFYIAKSYVKANGSTVILQILPIKKALLTSNYF